MRFAQHFSVGSITKELCKARLRLAEGRHDALFYHQIDRTRPGAEELSPPPTWREIPINIFPSRKRWNKYRSKDRSRQADPTLATLQRAIETLSVQEPAAQWCIGLRSAVDLITQRALSGNTTFTAPLIIKEIKDKKKRTYRPLAAFFLADKIIEGLTARYLRETLDQELSPSCLAFRPRKDGRHEGLNEILNRRTLDVDDGLFIAECDIMGFYDCVSHEIARESLQLLIDDARESDQAIKIDPRALGIFDEYLNCYSFLRNVKQTAEPVLQAQHPTATYPWRDDELRRLHDTSRLDQIGIPQGGALSGLIANAVLHRADKVMQVYCTAHEVTYLRYCDDIILLAPSRATCESALQAYCDVTRKLKLPIHEPKDTPSYRGAQRKAFWCDAKSKTPYQWGNPQNTDCFPWMQFLGYQVRYDGAVRVRRSSINKEMEKLARQADRLLRLLTPKNTHNLRKSKRSITHRIRMRLISMAVGRRDVTDPEDPMPTCWVSGFRWLMAKDIVLGNLKALDRQRERQINRVMRRLNTLAINVPPRANEDHAVRSHYGRPFSYWGQFARKRPPAGQQQ